MGGEAAGTAKWARCKKLRRFASDFRISVNRGFKGHLARAAAYHEERDGTWINEVLIRLLAAIHRNGSSRVRVYAFELWDAKTSELLACSFGVALGRWFHDFTMMTLERSKRNCGAVLTKAVGHALASTG